VNAQNAEYVTVAPPPGWVVESNIDHTYRPAQRGETTALLLDDQYQAETNAHYRRVVRRLETHQAVQEFSQFHLDFDPKTQHVTIHSLKVCRGESVDEQGSRQQFHILQREDQLEAYVLRGWLTLLVLFEDVQQGDVLDVSFTITTKQSLMPERFFLFQTTPIGNPVACWRLSVHFAAERAMQWKTSTKGPPTIAEADECKRWEWKGEARRLMFLETNLPPWFFASSWIQVTDCGSWAEVSKACASVWPLDATSAEIEALIHRLTSQSTNLEERVRHAAEHVQDVFRYFSSNIEFGGYVPAEPDIVFARKYGDCKDLACLLTVLLRRLGVPASPVLVNTDLASRIGDFLPMPAAFNHAIVEFSLGKERYWLDPTRRLQGGPLQQRTIQNFGFGLVIDSPYTSLATAPVRPRQSSSYRLREVFLLSTAGPESILEVRLTAKGADAEMLRNLFATRSEAWIALQREREYGLIFPRVKRLGRLTHADNRTSNEFVLAEAYEISGAIRPTNQATGCFTYESHLIRSILRQPLHEGRQLPCALPHPCRIEHEIEVEFSALPAFPLASLQSTHPALRLERDERGKCGSYYIKILFETRADAIMSDQFKSARTTIDEMWLGTGLWLELPLGVRGRRPRYLASEL